MKTLLQPEQQKARVSFSLRRPTYAEAQQIIKGQVFSMADYKRFVENHPQYQLPVKPDFFYKNEWVSSYDFLGTQTRNKSEHMKQYWAEVKNGTRTRVSKYKKAPKPVKAVEAKTLTVKPTTLQMKKQFLDLGKELGIYDHFKPAFKILFTQDELIELLGL